jgi:hypothetical protein
MTELSPGTFRRRSECRFVLLIHGSGLLARIRRKPATMPQPIRCYQTAAAARWGAAHNKLGKRARHVFLRSSLLVNSLGLPSERVVPIIVTKA